MSATPQNLKEDLSELVAGLCDALESLNRNKVGWLEIRRQAIDRFKCDSPSSFCPLNDQVIGAAAHIRPEQPLKSVIVIQTNCVKEFPEILSTFAGGTLRDEVRRHINTIVSLKPHGHVESGNTLENGGRQGIDYTPFRSKDILEVLIIKALKINLPHSILIAAAVHGIDYAAAAVIGLSLQGKRIFV